MSFSCLNNLLHVPPGGWRYTQKESGFLIQGGDYYDLREKVRKHRQVNRFLTGPELDNEIQEQICSFLSVEARAYFCKDCGALPQTRSLDLADVRHFLEVAKSWVRSPRFVAQAEANRRAEICASCPKNIPIAGCQSCQNLVKWTIELVGHRSTPFDFKLGGCEVCGCGNQAQVHLPRSVLVKGITSEMEFPSWCWKLPVSDQTPGGDQTVPPSPENSVPWEKSAL